MSHPSVHYKPVPNPHGPPEAVDEVDGDLEDFESSELEPLAPGGRTEKDKGRKFLSSLFVTHNDKLPPVRPGLPTPLSSDGVFSNIPAKPTSSRDNNKEDEELGPDEWIFMSPEQRKKLAPPKYSKIKRDRAPRYSTEYTPPTFPVRSRKHGRPRALNPRINSLPAGSSTVFFTAAAVSTLFPLVGFSFMYLTIRGRWPSHASRLGSRTGLGLGLFHIGAMMAYIPSCLPGFVTASSWPLIAFLLWTILIGLPFGWKLSLEAGREFMWLKTEERVLCANLGVVSSIPAAEEDEDDIESGYRYIEGTDIRVRDLRKILARARDARLARSLRSAGF